MGGVRRWVDSDGVRLAMWEEGESGRPVILLVHGYPDNSRVWAGVAARLADRFRVVRYDLRGHGESGAPAGRDGYLVARLVEDLVAVARATSPDGPVHVVGHDWGAMIGWAAVGDPRHATLFASFTAIGGPGLDHIPGWLRSGLRDPRRAAAMLRQMLRLWYIAAFQVPLLPELLWRIPALRARFHADYRDARNGLALYRANLLRRHSPAVSTIKSKLPTQQLALTQDQYCRPDLLAAADPWCDQLWRRELPAGHWAIRTHPTAVARLIAEFVDHAEGRPATPDLANARIADPPTRRRPA